MEPDEETRQRWAKDWPDYQMPPREKPPYDRDRLLPWPSHWPDSWRPGAEETGDGD